MHLVKSPYDNFSPDEVFLMVASSNSLAAKSIIMIICSFRFHGTPQHLSFGSLRIVKVLVKVGSSTSIVNVDLGMTIWVSCLSSSSR